MRIQKVIGTLMGLALVLGMATPARAEGTTLRVGFAGIHFDGFTPLGFNVQFGKEIKPSDNGGLDVVGEYTFVGKDGFKFNNFGGGVEQRYSPSGAMASFYVHGIAGLSHNNGFDANNLYTAFGGGVDVQANEDTSFFGQVDIVTVYFSGSSETGFRFVLGAKISR